MGKSSRNRHSLCYRLFKWKPYSFRRNYDKQGHCVRCPDCGAREFKETTQATVANTACEIDTHCIYCGGYVNFWAYGSYDPCFRYSDRSWPALLDRVRWRARGLPEP